MTVQAPAWARRYIGVPFVDKGRTLTGCDCLGLGRIIMLERCGIEIADEQRYDGTAKQDAERCAALHEETLRAGDWIPVEAGTEQAFDWLVVRVVGLPWHYAVVLAPGIAVHTMKRRQDSVLLRYREPEYRHVIAQPGSAVHGSGFYRHRLMMERGAGV